MRVTALILSAIVPAVLAAPAVVWKSAAAGESGNVVHTSSQLDMPELLADVLDANRSPSSLAAVVFLLSKGADGDESFSALASSGSIPRIAEKCEDAQTFYHHVGGIESAISFTKAAEKANKKLRVVKATLEDFNSKLPTIGQPEPEIKIEAGELGMVSRAVKQTLKHARDLASSDVLIVSIDPATVDPAEIDSAVVSAIESDLVRNVLLTSVRSLNEVKQERYSLSKKRMDIMEQEGQKVLQARRRRLEQEDAQEDADNQNQNADLTGVYYVYMTPNILAGILFTLLFAVVTWIGVTCMGAIAGQDVYVSKMPSVGREA